MDKWQAEMLDRRPRVETWALVSGATVAAMVLRGTNAEFVKA
jgi:hypothetical protein